MGKIVAIGGGELRHGETEKIDKYIVKLSNIEFPKLLFIPTASNDAEGYIKTVNDKYSALGCDVDTLCLVSNTYSDEEIKEKIFSSNIIYVGGGNTVSMMQKWKEHRVDVYLKEAYKRVIVLSGLSAGSICWFIRGHSDNSSSNKHGKWDNIRPYGLGLIPAVNCVHYNEEGREGFDESMSKESICGIALEDNTAFVENDGKYLIIKSNDKFKAYILKSNDNGLIKKELTEGIFKFI